MNATEETIFNAALDKHDRKERAAFLVHACGGDAGLRGRVERLLSAYGEGAFLESPAAGFAAAPYPDPTDGPGTLIGPYKLLEQIGEGGMGLVYMAEQQRPVRRLVALKLVKPGMDSKQVIARFEAERQALAMMDHPHIARILDAGTVGEVTSASGWWLEGQSNPAPTLATSTSHSAGRPYFVMELVRGIPINEFCDQKQLTVRQRLELMIQVCQAVQHAHQKGIIHRDLKPTNVLVTMNDVTPLPKVIDFGIAKALDQQLTECTLHTGFAQLVGTPLYMSPEQAEMNHLGVDTRSDVYSLGVMLYELLTGTTPFDSDRLKSVGFDEMRRIIREEEPETVSARIAKTKSSRQTPSAVTPVNGTRSVPTTFAELDWIVVKALEKDRNRRYESASALAADIERFLNDEAVQACPPSAAYRLKKIARRHRGTLLAGASVAAALVIGLVGTTWQAIRATQSLHLAGDRLVAQNKAERNAREAAQRAENEAARASSEAKRATNEAAIAEAINKFLNDDLLKQADPEREPDRTIQLKTILDRAAANIGDRFHQQPLVEAAIRATLGETYFRLGDYPAAAPQLERSQALRRAVLGDDDAATVQSAALLGELYKSQEQFVDAESLLRGVVERHQRVLGEEHPETLAALVNLAGVYHKLGRYSEVVPTYLRVLEIREQTGAVDDQQTVELLLALGNAYLERGHHGVALPYFRRALELSLRRFGAEHPQTLICQFRLGKVYGEQSRTDEAIALLTQTVAAQSRILGETNPSTLVTMGALAVLYNKQGRDADAKALAEKVLDIRRKVLGDEHLSTMASKYYVATFDKTADRDTKLEQALLEDVAILRRRNLEQHPMLFEAEFRLAQIYARRRRQADSEQLYLHSIGGLRRVRGNADLHLLEALGGLGLLYVDQARYAEAEPLLVEVLKTRRRELSDEHPSTANALNNLAYLYQHLGRYSEAEPLFVEAWQTKRRTIGEGHFLTLRSMNNVAMMYRFEGRYQEAASLLEETLSISRRSLGDDHPETLNHQSNLATVHEKLGDFAKAEPLHRQVLDLRQAKLGPEHPQMIMAMANLGRNLSSESKFDEAEPLLRRCVALTDRLEPDLWTTFHRKSILGEALAGKATALVDGDRPAAEQLFVEAETLLKTGYEGLLARESKIPAYSKDSLTDALQRLVELYTAWDKPEEAAKWQMVLDAKQAESAK